ncbi:MAG: anhydro-N-acetylmuramic acid kinase [Gammaproteobacteria bacterium]
MTGYFLGMISGTSVDGVDAALCRFGDRHCTVVSARTFAYPPAIRQRLESLIASQNGLLTEIGALDVAVGRYFADCALALLADAEIGAHEVDAIGHHGQTICHQPDPPEPFSWQIGDPNSIAAITGIDTVADLRRLDMALGGQGAPMVPIFHEWLFASDVDTRVVLNLGGIANVTVLAPGRDPIGFDTGPANTLLDRWIQQCLDRPFDEDGRWAASGDIDRELLEVLLGEPYFDMPAPKSTGRELFHLTWLKQKLGMLSRSIDDANVQATLLELTAASIGRALARLDLGNYELIVCGGGARNGVLRDRIAAQCGRPTVTTAEHGLDPDWVEAAAFAWLARARLQRDFGNLPTVTGARLPAILGALYCGSRTTPT